MRVRACVCVRGRVRVRVCVRGRMRVCVCVRARVCACASRSDRSKQPRLLVQLYYY